MPRFAAGAAAIGILGAILIVVLLSQPADRPPQPSSSPIADRPGLAKFDRASGALAREVEPTELVTITLFAGTEERAVDLARRVRDLGLTPTTAGGEVPQVIVTGQYAQLVDLLASSLVNRASLTEDTSALRPVAAPARNDSSGPVPGFPYRDGGLPVDPNTVHLPADLRGVFLAGLADTMSTFDGRPYAELAVEAGCTGTSTPEGCGLIVTGMTVPGSGRVDRWAIYADAASNWFPVIDRSDPLTLRAIPRWLGREAERIARADDDTLAAIRRYDRIDGFTWVPDAPGVIVVVYSRACEGLDGRLASLAGGRVAEASGCLDYLKVSVDVRSGDVVQVGD